MTTHTHEPRLRRGAVAPQSTAQPEPTRSADGGGIVTTLPNPNARSTRRHAPIATEQAAHAYRVVLACHYAADAAPAHRSGVVR